MAWVGRIANPFGSESARQKKLRRKYERRASGISAAQKGGRANEKDRIKQRRKSKGGKR